MAAADDKDKKSSFKPITEEQRLRYIGFEVFPGKPKDLFKSDSEKRKYVEGVLSKRQKGDLIREGCTLMEERVSFADRLVLTIASVLIIITLFIPWYAAYNEIVEEAAPAEALAAVTDSTAMAAAGDSLMAAGDSLAQAAATAVTPVPREGVVQQSAAEEVMVGYVAKKKIHKEYSRLSGLGSLVSLGSVGSYVFSSGGVLVVTAIVLLIYTLLCIGAPVYTLYGIYGVKGDPDQRALRLKKMLRVNWIPVVLFILALIFSFFGAEYGNNAGSLFTSLGKSYGPGAFLGTLSWGMIVSLSGFVLAAVKGAEI